MGTIKLVEPIHEDSTAKPWPWWEKRSRSSGYKQKDKNWRKQYQLSNAHARMKL